ncbi:MAG: 50S ribosomal protein L1 [Candidatus Jacksonbacteria bacterium]
MSKRSKRFQSNQQKIEKETYTFDEAIKIIKEQSNVKFDESIEVHFNLGIDSKKSEQTIRGSAVLPHGTGKTVKIAVFTESKQKEAKEAQADIIGGKELIEEIIKTKKADFDVAVATPDIMRDLARAAKILGPKGLMPSPKTGTVTENISQTVNKLKTGQINFRNDDFGNIHQGIGKLSWDMPKIKENFNILLTEIKKQRPKGVKGVFIKSVTLCSSMGPGVKIVL